MNFMSQAFMTIYPAVSCFIFIFFHNVKQTIFFFNISKEMFLWKKYPHIQKPIYFHKSLLSVSRSNAYRLMMLEEGLNITPAITNVKEDPYKKTIRLCFISGYWIFVGDLDFYFYKFYPWFNRMKSWHFFRLWVGFLHCHCFTISLSLLPFRKSGRTDNNG